MKLEMNIIDKSLLALSIILALGASQVLMNENQPEIRIPAEVVVAYSKWKTKHGILNGSPNEDHYRLRVFHQTYKMIQEENQKNLTYKLGLNKFSATTWKEYISKTGAIHKPPQQPRTMSTQNQQYQSLTQDHPPKVDWEAKDRVSPAREVFCSDVRPEISSMLLETAAAIKDNKPPTRRSSQQIIDCYLGGSDRCTKAMDKSFVQYLVYLGYKGATTEANYPMQKSNPYFSSCNDGNILSPLQSSGFGFTRIFSDFNLEKALINGVVSVGLFTCPKLKQYQSGIFDYDCSKDQDKKYTYKLLTGYDRNELWWKIRSFNGKDYGENGNVRVTKVNGQVGSGNCGILEEGYFVKGIDG